MRKKIKVHLPDMGIGFFCVDMIDADLDLLIFRILPFEAVLTIGKALISMGYCSGCDIQTSTDAYRSHYVLERIEVTLSGFDRSRYTESHLSRLCMESATALGYELYHLSIDELINLKAKTAYNKRKRYI